MKYRELVKQEGNALTNIDVHYAKLTEKYGVNILPKADRWNSVNCLRFIGSRFLIDERTDEAIEVLMRWVKYRPKSAEAMQALAKAYQVSGDLKTALSTQKKAIELAQIHDIESLNSYKEFLTELKN